MLLTHGHVDHASAAGTMAEHYGVKIEGPHKDDLYLIEGLPESGAKYNFPAYKPFVPDRWLENGDTVTLGNLTFDVVHCPGHTPGHVVFVHKPSQIAFVGDVLFRGSIGRTDFPRGNHEQLLSSIRERLWPFGDDTQFVPGHGQTSTFGWERKTNPLRRRPAVRRLRAEEAPRKVRTARWLAAGAPSRRGSARARGRGAASPW